MTTLTASIFENLKARLTSNTEKHVQQKVTHIDSNLTLSEYLDKYSHHLWSKKDHFQSSLNKVNEFIDFADNRTRPISDFLPIHIYDFLHFLEHEKYNRRTRKFGLKNGTINRYHSALSKVFGKAVELRIIEQAPKATFKKARSSRPRYFSAKEILQLKAFFRKHNRPEMEHMVTLGLTTGMRKAEILGINQTPQSLPDHLDTYGELRRVDGRLVVYLRETKNGVPRIVPLNSEAQDALNALGGKPLDSYNHHTFYYWWHRARQNIAEGDTDFVFHVTRHTFATTLANDHQVNSLILADVMGHTSLSTTQKYTHPKTANVAGVLDKLNY